ncbi:Myosin light chain kinase 3 [Varanus komodoensis]|nr:Myosin light chain kinase 3 [Varanus komodoensis]
MWMLKDVDIRRTALHLFIYYAYVPLLFLPRNSGRFTSSSSLSHSPSNNPMRMSECNLEPEEGFMRQSRVTKGNSLSTMDTKLNLLNEKVDKLLNVQEDLTEKLQIVNQGIDNLGKGLQKLSMSQMSAEQIGGVKRGLKSVDGAHQLDTQSVCSEILRLMKATHQDTSKYRERLEKMEKMVDSVDKVVKCLGETFKNSKMVDFILKGGVAWRKGSPIEILEETKDKPEEKGAKGKHAPASKGIQAEGKTSLQENNQGKMSDDHKGVCEKVNLAGTGLSKADSGSPGKEKMAQCAVSEMHRQATDPKDCPKLRDAAGVSPTVQNHGLFLSGGNPVGSQNMDKSPGLGELPKASFNPKRKGSEKTILRHGEVAPPIPKSGGEVIRTRLLINVQMSDAQEKTPKSREGSAGGGHGGRSVGSLPSLLPPWAEGAKQLPEPSQAKQPSKGSRTESAQDTKGLRSPNRQGEQKSKIVGPAPSAAPPGQSEEKGESKSKGALCLGSVAKDAGRDPASLAKSPKETTKTTAKDCMKDVRSEVKESRSAPLRRQESRSSPGAGKPAENAAEPGAGKAEDLVIDDSPPPPAPFEHRIVSIKQTELTDCYLVCHHEVLGGGRFGQVHKCTEKSTGLCLAAKIIKVKVAKEREEVKNEINIMNQLNHVNLIQLYDAFESKNNITLIMEYVDGGELFDRIIDENYNLTELDAILFTKQICEGIHYLHQQYILHLDLKPENILCVNHTGNQIKIIDFGLARRYKPREKLKVNFGTPEFLAPEVVNYDFVSFPTDMWSSSSCSLPPEKEDSVTSPKSPSDSMAKQGLEPGPPESQFCTLNHRKDAHSTKLPSIATWDQLATLLH